MAVTIRDFEALPVEIAEKLERRPAVAGISFDAKTLMDSYNAHVRIEDNGAWKFVIDRS